LGLFALHLYKRYTCPNTIPIRFRRFPSTPTAQAKALAPSSAYKGSHWGSRTAAFVNYTA